MHCSPQPGFEAVTYLAVDLPGQHQAVVAELGLEQYAVGAAIVDGLAKVVPAAVLLKLVAIVYLPLLRRVAP